MKSLLILAALALAAPASAQRLLLDNNVELEWSDVTLSGSNLQVTVKKPDGSTSVQSTPASRVARVDWPYPQELADALSLILQQKYDAAIAKAETVRAIHVNWKDKPGSWFPQAALLIAECHVKTKKNEEAEKIFTELRSANVSGTNQKAMVMVQAMMDLEKGATTPALAKAQTAAQQLEDSALMARLQLLIADIRFKEEKFEDARDAYLQVPVFFGAQGQLMPVAELGAARSLRALKLLDEANKAFGRIVNRYRGTPEAAAASKEREEIEKLLTGGATPEAKPAEPAKPAEEDK